jgi:hypothetical protein
MKYLFCFLFIFIQFFVKAQDKKITEPVLTGTFLPPGVAYEIPVGQRTTIKFRAALEAGFSYGNGTIVGPRYSFSFIPTLIGEYRYYYNIEKRMKANKNSRYNSASYFAAAAKYGISYTTHHIEGGSIFKTTTKEPNAGIVWGLQRNYRNRFSLDFNIGPSILYPLLYQQFGLIGNFTLGIRLGKQTE